MLALQLLILIAVANGTPVLVARLLGRRCAWPVDGGRRLGDGGFLFGATKTWRGLVAALLATGLVAPLIGLPAPLGLLIGAGAMLGDLASSFTKRRLGRASSSRAPGLDQIPEALLPLLLAMPFLDYGWPTVLLVSLLFTVMSMGLSPLLFRIGIRRQPH